MSTSSTVVQKNASAKIVLLLSIFVSVFWYLGRVTDVYQIAVVGAIFEMMWLPMIGLLLLLPVISIILLFKEKFSFRSLYLYSLIIIGFSLLMVQVFK